MFQDIAQVYDLMKAHRNYTGEAVAIRRLIQSHAPQARTLFEVACGTGTLLAELHGFERVGLDVSPQMLDVARKKLGVHVALHQGKMEDFQLPRPGVEVLLCLDGAIGYVRPAELEPTLSTFARHMVSGGLLVLEPWYTPEDCGGLVSTSRNEEHPATSSGHGSVLRCWCGVVN